LVQPERLTSSADPSENINPGVITRRNIAILNTAEPPEGTKALVSGAPRCPPRSRRLPAVCRVASLTQQVVLRAIGCVVAGVLSVQRLASRRTAKLPDAELVVIHRRLVWILGGSYTASSSGAGAVNRDVTDCFPGVRQPFHGHGIVIVLVLLGRTNSPCWPQQAGLVPDNP
jgi:hypothetical protein